jgi:hypothetical protein
MRSKLKIIKILLTSFLYVSAIGVLHAETDTSGHSHGHDEHSVSKLSLNKGSKWKTDAPLRQGMKKINDAFFMNASSFHDDTLTKQDAGKLAKKINDQIEYLIENCKLEPEADAVLHVLIGDLLQGAEVIKKTPLSMSGMPKIHKALMLYPDYFEHSGW